MIESILSALISWFSGWLGRRKAAKTTEAANDRQAEATVDVARQDDATEARLDASRTRSAGDVVSVAAGSDGPDGILRRRAIVKAAINRANTGGELP